MQRMAASFFAISVVFAGACSDPPSAGEDASADAGPSADGGDAAVATQVDLLIVAADTLAVALPPRLSLVGVPSTSMMAWSTCCWRLASMPITAGPMTSSALRTATCTPRPPHLSPPS